jgi:hypothetical protein
MTGDNVVRVDMAIQKQDPLMNLDRLDSNGAFCCGQGFGYIRVQDGRGDTEQFGEQYKGEASTISVCASSIYATTA